MARRLPKYYPDTTSYRGYRSDFIDPERLVPLPDFSPSLQRALVPMIDTEQVEIPYQNFSLFQHHTRRLAVLTAANIDGGSFWEITRQEVRHGTRSDKWYKDRRLPRTAQWGNQLYSAPRSDFDKGHLTKREDVQWGPDHATGLSGGRSTFFYTNAAPQHRDLNRRIWAKLEDYLLHDEAVARGERIYLFTGPVLADNDPEFVTPIRGERMQLPTMFWKVIYYQKEDGELHRVAFLLGQAHLWRRDEIALFPRGAEPFADFEAASTYQVEVPTVEQLTGLTFASAHEVYQDPRPLALILSEVKGRGADAPVETRIQNLRL